MKEQRFFLMYTLLMIAQIIMSNSLNLSHFVVLSILPMMVLCIPISVATAYAIIIAFLTGLATDFFATGSLGLTSFALMPVALTRNTIIKLVCGEEVFARKEDISIRRQGLPKMLLAISFAEAIYLILFVWIESAGMRPFWADAIRFGASLVVGSLASMLTVDLLAPDRVSSR